MRTWPTTSRGARPGRLDRQPGAEIRSHRPTPRHILASRDADLVLWNGLGLELRLKGWPPTRDAVSHAVLPGLVLANIAGAPLALGAFASGLFCAMSAGWIGALIIARRSSRVGDASA